jgi:hypothetical protein
MSQRKRSRFLCAKLAGKNNYFVSSLPASACQKKESRKIDEIGDVQGFS